MFSEGKHILPLIKAFINIGCDSDKFDSLDASRKKIKSYFKKDENDCLSIYDQDYSIKCIFEKKFLENYFSTQPSYLNLDSFENSLVLIKKYHFDVLMVKNINETISLRIVLFISDFEVDLYQKKTCLAIKPNINRSIEIVTEMKNFMWKFSQEFNRISNKEPQLFQARNFTKKEFKTAKGREKQYSSFVKIMENNLNNVLINENISIEEKPSLLNLVNILEETENLPIVDDNINLENIMNFDFNKILGITADRNLGESLIKIKSEDGFENRGLDKHETPSLLGRKRILIEESKSAEDKTKIMRSNAIARASSSIKNLLEKYQNLNMNRDAVEKYYKYKSFV